MNMSIVQISRYPERQSWAKLVGRPRADDPTLTALVRGILDDVRVRGDLAVREYSRQFDGAAPERTRVSRDELRVAAQGVRAELRSAVQRSIASISAFHQVQRQSEPEVETVSGIRCFRRAVPIERVGIYIPAGTAPLFSTLIMLAVPARIAGCREIVLASPGGRDACLAPAIALCAELLEIQEVYLMGGAQAIAAFAYGTETVRPVDKICGPGNRYVNEAKQQVAARGTAIDLPAGPSEVLVIADEGARASWIAADLLAQAEHGPDSQVVLVTTSEGVLCAVAEELRRQCERLPRAQVAREALKASRAILVRDLQEAFDFSNLYAPEHLIVALAEPDEWVERIVNAGSVFLGGWTPEALGDYASGTNHVLPTGGAARGFSGVSVDSFMKKITFQRATRAGLTALAPCVTTMARAEGLEAHARALEIREEDEG